MLLVARGSVQDVVTTNEGCQPITTTQGCSTDVFVRGFGVHRIGDSNTPHTFGPPACPTHQTYLSTGSATVFANSKGVGRYLDMYVAEIITTVTQASVFAGDF